MSGRVVSFQELLKTTTKIVFSSSINKMIWNLKILLTLLSRMRILYILWCISLSIFNNNKGSLSVVMWTSSSSQLMTCGDEVTDKSSANFFFLFFLKYTCQVNKSVVSKRSSPGIWWTTEDEKQDINQQCWGFCESWPCYYLRILMFTRDKVFSVFLPLLIILCFKH